MNDEELLQQVLNMTIERFGKQAKNYEAEIANLHAQILVLSNKAEGMSKTKTKAAPPEDA
jgi:hypothetical protein